MFVSRYCHTVMVQEAPEGARVELLKRGYKEVVAMDGHFLWKAFDSEKEALREAVRIADWYDADGDIEISEHLRRTRLEE